MTVGTVLKMSFEFSGQVRDELPEHIREQLAIDLERVFVAIEPARVPVSVFVPRLFSGYSPDYGVKIVLAVEVTHADGYERHIVKVGHRDKVETDFNGWQECTSGRMVASRIFAAVRRIQLDENRIAVIYRDAFSLFGPNEGQSDDSAPKLLEEAIDSAVLKNEPDPMSAQRAISHVFTDLGVWFYRGALENAAEARNFFAKHLRIQEKDSPSDAILPHWQNDKSRMELRRHAVWVLCGRDVPDADPESKPARYLDPVDFVRWSMQDSGGKRLPATLVGRTHGDLHARNVLVGVRRGEVQYPAVYDYGDMSSHNVLAWDFAKLETELKVRLLPAICRDQDVFEWLVNRSRLRQAAIDTPAAHVVTENTRRANRLAAFLAFEELIDDLSKTIEDKHDLERLVPLSPLPSGIQKLDRLAEIILRIRQEAAYWLGFKPAKRQKLWKDELYFALGVYGLLNVRWDYSGPEQESALISAGVAVARMLSTPKLLKSAIESGSQPNANYPSYRVPLALCYRDWKQKEYRKGCQFVEELVLTLKCGDRDVVTQIEIRPSIQHAVPLIGQALLLELEAGHLHAVELILETMRDEARTFHDYETLARIGRLYKDAADRKSEAESPVTVGEEVPLITRATSLQMYDKSFEVYSEAYLLTKDWYVGINAATLAMLTGKQEVAKQYAREVAATCSAKLDHEKKDRYWLFATEGEAALLLDEPATDFYQSAISELSPGQWGMADSSYRQAIRLWRLFGCDGNRRVGPVLDLFESSDARHFLTRGFLGRTPLEKP